MQCNKKPTHANTASGAEVSSPALSVPAVHPVVQPSDSTVCGGSVLTDERKARGSRGEASPPGPGRTSALTHTGRLDRYTSSSRTTDGDTASRLSGEYTSVGKIHNAAANPAGRRCVSPLEIQFYSLVRTPHCFQPLFQRDVAVRVRGVGHDRLFGVRTSDYYVRLHHVSGA